MSLVLAISSALMAQDVADIGIIGGDDGPTAIEVVEGQPALAADDLLLADVPVLYGEDGFRQRILERTNGERDPIGLVLTGGSARAFAHLGVLKYLEEKGIEPDYIISNSMGSIIAMLYAAGLSSDQIMSVITSGDLSTFFKMTIPVNGGLLEPTGFRGLIESVVGPDAQIEDLEIFENVAYVMAYHADNSIPAKIEDWLDQFDMFSIYEVLPQILELWGENLVTDVTSKKRLAEVSGK